MRLAYVCMTGYLEGYLCWAMLLAMEELAFLYGANGLSLKKNGWCATPPVQSRLPRPCTPLAGLIHFFFRFIVWRLVRGLVRGLVRQLVKVHFILDPNQNIAKH